MVRSIGLAEAKSKLSDLVGRVAYAGEMFILERRGRPMAMLIGVEEYQRLKELAGISETPSHVSLPPELRRRQEMLVAQARQMEARFGDPVDGLARLLRHLPPEEDRFWAEIHETG